MNVHTYEPKFFANKLEIVVLANTGDEILIASAIDIKTVNKGQKHRPLPKGHKLD